LTEDGITFPKMVGGQYTLPFNLLNWCPVVSVPAGISSQGIPIGMQIIGKPHDTETVLRVAYAFSKGGPKLYTGKLFPKAADAK
jgi:Asp-tRNA(Asn)/Glu-tRNA(Gln) amidotransferase A subunit family amidase